MLKEAKSPPDAVQQKLRQNKKAWNAVVKAFIDDLIHYKKLMNGAPNKFFKQKGDIKYPIPADPTTIIGALAGDFNEIAQAANRLIQEQASFSANRRKRQSQNMKQTSLPLGPSTSPSTSGPAPTPPSTPAQPNLEQQLGLPMVASHEHELIKVASYFEEKYFLEKEASNPISRFFTRLLTPTFGFGKGPGIRRARMAMLSSCATLFKGLEHLQAEVVNASAKNLGLSAKMALKLFHEWRKVKLGFDAAAKLVPEAPAPSENGGKIDTPSLPKQDRDKSLEDKPSTAPTTEAPSRGQNIPVQPSVDTLFTVDAAKKCVEDYTRALRSGVFTEDLGAFAPLNNAINKFQMLPDHGTATNVINEYKAVVASLAGKYNSTATSLQGLSIEREASSVHQLEVLSQTFLKKWWGKGKHQLSSDETSSLRLGVYDQINETRKLLDQIMDLLEDGLDVKKLEPLISEVNVNMSKIKMTIRTLAISYGGVSESRIPLH